MVTIGSRRFPSKEAAANEIRRVRAQFQRGALEPQDIQLLHDLISQHPAAAEKIGCGVDHFEVRVGLGGHLQFWIVRRDGTETDFSFLKCLKLKPRANRDHAIVAMRCAVVDQVIEARDLAFRDSPTLRCSVSNELITAETCEMDHQEPFTFVLLADGFAEMLGGYEQPQLATVAFDGEQGRHFRDAAIAARWQEHHRRYATLRPVSVVANQGILRQRPQNETARIAELDRQRNARDKMLGRGYDYAPARTPRPFTDTPDDAQMAAQARKFGWDRDIRASDHIVHASDVCLVLANKSK